MGILRIKVESDIHIDFEGHFPKLDDVDLYILPGDVGEDVRGLRFCKELLIKYPNLNIIHVPGNHEYYRGNKYTLEKIDAILSEESFNTLRYHYLQNSSVVLQGIKFIGATLWTDFNNMDPVDMVTAQTIMGDFKAIRTKEGGYSRLLPNKVVRLHKRSREYIFNELERSEEPCIVVTHHKPYRSEYNDLAPAYEVDMDESFDNCNNLPKYWFYGHTHKSEVYLCDRFREEVTFISNCKGYPFEKSTGFDSDFILDI
jgi:predicted phosphohydrolase